MNADAYFEIGASHVVCEDYALAGGSPDRGLSYVIVADGCSSSPDTDVGARLLCHISKDVIEYLVHRKLLYDPVFLEERVHTVFQEMVVRKALEVRSALRLSYDAFDSTLLIGIALGPYISIVLVYGDGHVLARYPGGQLRHISVEYTKNAPYYLSYLMSNQKEYDYREAFFYGQSVVVRDEISEDGNTWQKLIEDSPRQANGPFVGMWHFRSKNVSDEPFVSWPASQILLATDGIGTYERTARELSTDERPVDTSSRIVPELMRYKNLAGSFVQRRMKRMRKNFEKEGIIHQDDVGCAAIDFGDEKGGLQ